MITVHFSTLPKIHSVIYSVSFLVFVDESNMLLYWDQERTRLFPGPLFQQQENPSTYYLDQGLRHSVSMVCIQSTGEIVISILIKNEVCTA